MEEFDSIEEKLENISIELSNQYIESFEDEESTDFSELKVDQSILSDIFSECHRNFDDTPQKLPFLKKSLAISLYTLSKTTDTESTVVALRILLSIWTLPSAFAFGLTTNSMTVYWVNSATKLLTNLVNTSGTVEDKKKNKKDSNSIVDDNDSEEERESENKMRKKRSTIKNTSSKQSFQSKDLLSLLSEMNENLSVFITFNTAEYLVSSFAELLVGFMVLFSVKISSDQESWNVLTGILKKTSCENKQALISIIRIFLAVTTFSARLRFYPSDLKLRKNCHLTAIKLMSEIFLNSCKNSNFPQNTTTALDNFEDISTGQMIPTTPKTPSTTDKNHTMDTGSGIKTLNQINSEFPFPYQCMIGFLQRILFSLSSIDKLPIRTVLLESATELFLKLRQGFTSAEGFENCPLGLKALEKFLDFVKNLVTCSKAPLRGAAVDFSTQLILSLTSTSTPTISSNDTSTSTVSLRDTIESVCFRLQDSVATVRARAVAAVFKMLTYVSTYLEQLQVEPCELQLVLYDLAMGISSKGYSLNLVDLLKNRAMSGEKPILRVKALQSISLLLTINWPRPASLQDTFLAAQDTSVEADFKDKVDDYMTILLSEEDLMVFSEATSDNSVSVRKQAFLSFFQLLYARPMDFNLQIHFTRFILPMVFDAETSITQKLSNFLYDTFILEMCKFVDFFLPENTTSPSTSQLQPSRSNLGKWSLVWVLAFRAMESGLGRILKVAVQSMLKSGILKGHEVGSRVCSKNQVDYKDNFVSLQYVLKKLEIACCCHLNPKTQNLGSAQKLGFEGEMGLNWDLQPCSREEVSKAAWVLLECLVTLDGTKVVVNGLNPKSSANQQVPLEDILTNSGSAGFIVQCYQQKHQKRINLLKSLKPSSKTQIPDIFLNCCWDEEDLRMFTILVKLSKNLQKTDFEFMKNEIFSGLRFLCPGLLDISGFLGFSEVLGFSDLGEEFKEYYEKVKKKINSGAINCCSAQLIAVSVSLLLQFSQCQAEEKIENSVSKTEIENSGVTASSLRFFYSDVAIWVNKLMSEVKEVLNGFILPNPSLKQNSVFSHFFKNSNFNPLLQALIPKQVNNAIFLLGELALLGFSLEEEENKWVPALNPGFSLKPDFLECVPIVGDFFSNRMDRVTNSAVGYQCPFKIRVYPEVVDLVKILMGHELPVETETENQTENEKVVRRCPVEMRANAFLCMGKLCLRDKNLARDQVNVFLREIQTVDQGNRGINGFSEGFGNNVSVRSNAVLVLGDWCLRYTQLVERHVDTIASCLQDESPMLRKNCLTLLAQLLLQDFIKWKGLLLYRFLALTVDDDLDIADFAQNLLRNSLATKYPDILNGHFVEAMVIFNNCVQHPLFLAITQGFEGTTENKKTLFLPSEKRFKIYEFLTNYRQDNVKPIDDEDKLQILFKVVQDVLGFIVDNPDFLDRTTGGSRLTSGEILLKEAIELLKSPMLKIGNKKSSTDDDHDMFAEAETENGNSGIPAQENNDKAAALQKAKNKVVKGLSRQYLMSHMLPVTLSLKHILEVQHSPLQGFLMDLLVHLAEENPTEVNQALEYDPSLKAELDYDLKQYKLKQQQEFKQKELSAEQESQSVNQSVMNKIQKSSVKKSFSQSARKMSPYLNNSDIIMGTAVKASLKKTNSNCLENCPISDDFDPFARLTNDNRENQENEFNKDSSEDSRVLEKESEVDEGFDHRRRRRSWGVVVDSLLVSEKKESTLPVQDPHNKTQKNEVLLENEKEEKFTPAKKRGKKSTPVKTKVEIYEDNVGLNVGKNERKDKKEKVKKMNDRKNQGDSMIFML